MFHIEFDKKLFKRQNEQKSIEYYKNMVLLIVRWITDRPKLYFKKDFLILKMSN